MQPEKFISLSHSPNAYLSMQHLSTRTKQGRWHITNQYTYTTLLTYKALKDKNIFEAKESNEK